VRQEWAFQVLHKEREYSWMDDEEPIKEEEDVATIDSILVEVPRPVALADHRGTTLIRNSPPR